VLHSHNDAHTFLLFGQQEILLILFGLGSVFLLMLIDIAFSALVVWVMGDIQSAIDFFSDDTTSKLCRPGVGLFVVGFMVSTFLRFLFIGRSMKLTGMFFIHGAMFRETMLEEGQNLTVGQALQEARDKFMHQLSSGSRGATYEEIPSE